MWRHVGAPCPREGARVTGSACGVRVLGALGSRTPATRGPPARAPDGKRDPSQRRHRQGDDYPLSTGERDSHAVGAVAPQRERGDPEGGGAGHPLDPSGRKKAGRPPQAGYGEESRVARARATRVPLRGGSGSRARGILPPGGSGPFRMATPGATLAPGWLETNEPNCVVNAFITTMTGSPAATPLTLSHRVAEVSLNKGSSPTEGLPARKFGAVPRYT